MAGLFGVLRFQPDANTDYIFQQLQDSARQGFDHRQTKYADEQKRVSIGCILPEKNQLNFFESKDKRFVLFVFGRLFLPDGELLNGISFETKLLPSLLNDLTANLSRLDGAYLLALYDAEKCELLLINDAFGNFAMHYYHDERMFLFGTQLNGIRKVIKRVEWNWQSVHEFIGLGLILNGHTWYRNIARLPAGEFLRINKNGIQIERYVRTEYAAEGSREQNFENIREGIEGSVKSYLKSDIRIGAALSGGYDSRITWSIIRSIKPIKPVTAFTHGTADSRDVRIAKMICEHFGIPHLINSFNPDDLQNFPMLWHRFTELNEGANSITAAHALLSWQKGSQFYETLMDSHGGVLYRRQFMKVAEKRLSGEQYFAAQLYRNLQSALSRLPFLKTDISEKLAEACISGLEKYFDQPFIPIKPADKIDTYYRFQVSGLKYAYAGNAEMNYLQVAHPLLNIVSFEALQKVHPDSRRNQAIYRYIVNKTCPQMKHFGLENMGLPAPYFGFNLLRYPPMVYERMLRKMALPFNYSMFQKLSLRRPIVNYETQYTAHFDIIREILLRPNYFFNELFDRTQLEIRLKKQEDNISQILLPFGELLTLKLYLDIFHPN